MTTPLHIPPVVQKYLDEEAPKGITIKLKSESFSMKALGLVAKRFNPRFDEYHTTIGKTIYVADSFQRMSEVKMLELIIHESFHASDSERLGWFGLPFKLAYLFPQILTPVLVVALWLGVVWWAGLLGLLLAAPIPAWFRYKFELRAYRTSFLVAWYAQHEGDEYTTQLKNWIKEQLSKRWYYWTWPFPGSIEKELEDEGFKFDPEYSKITTFLLANFPQP